MTASSQPSSDLLPRIAFFLAIVFFSCLYGLLAARYDWFPNGIVKGAPTRPRASTPTSTCRCTTCTLPATSCRACWRTTTPNATTSC